jgi:hypothetical protein
MDGKPPRPACAGVDPALFDATTLEEAEPGLQHCRRCSTVEACLRAVNPRSTGFDGVAGGRVWRAGSVVRLNGRTRPEARFGIPDSPGENRV